MSGPALVFFLLGLGVSYALGYHRAVNQRANKDYKVTKAAVPVLRKAFWTTLGTALRAALIAAVCLFALITWNVVNSQDQDKSTVPAKVKPSPTAKR